MLASAAGRRRLCFSDELLNDGVQVRVARAKASRQPISATLCDPLTVSENFELPCFPRPNHGFDSEPISDHGREPRDLGSIAVSCRALNDLDCHALAGFLAHSIRRYSE